MYIDEYDFGWIIIDGRRYESDVIIAGGQVIPNWWREEGHRLAIADLKNVIRATPKLLVVGTGKAGQMSIPTQTSRFLSEQGIELEACDTTTACSRFNQLVAAGCNVAAAFHLTC